MFSFENEVFIIQSQFQFSLLVIESIWLMACVPSLTSDTVCGALMLIKEERQRSHSTTVSRQRKMQHLLLLFFFLFLLSEQNEGRLGFKSPNRGQIKDDKIETHVVKHRNKGWKIGTIKDRGGEDYQDDNDYDGKVIITCDYGMPTLGTWVCSDKFCCTCDSLLILMLKQGTNPHHFTKRHFGFNSVVRDD